MRAAIALVAAALVLALPTAGASPETDAYDAITASWEAAGGATSALGAPHGEVYAAGVGFAQDFAGGKIFFTPETGARALYGAILEKYESLGGPAQGDVGFPSSNEVPGLVSPDSRVALFSAADNPVIYWTPEHGAHLVRGPINAGWDKLGSSTGVLGVPVGDETYTGDTISQKFGGGQLSWNGQTKQFATVPPELAAQLADVQVPDDPTAAINRAWRAVGGSAGRLGDKKGDQFQVGDDGAGQDFAGGRVYYSPATGAHAITGEVLSKYESLGGPLGSDLGFPIAGEAAGGIAGSRVGTFAGSAADDEPVIFAAPKKGAFVVRGAMKAVWDKLDGATGALGAPVGDQAIDGQQVSQKFAGGTVFWNRATNTLSTEPPNLAKSLSGLQLPGMDTASSVAVNDTGSERAWNWWWLAVAVAVLALAGALGWAIRWWRRRGDGAPGRAPRRISARIRDTRAGDDYAGDDTGDDYAGDDTSDDYGGDDYRGDDYRGDDYGGDDYRGDDYAGDDYAGDDDAGDYAVDNGTDSPAHAADGWSVTDGGAESTVRLPSHYRESVLAGISAVDPVDPVDESPSNLSWGGAAETAAEDPDDVDTAPTRIPSEVELRPGRHAGAGYRFESDASPPSSGRGAPAHPMMHLPLDDPYQPPHGYPVKANLGSGLYYTADSALYDDTLAEVWFADEESARLNGFVKAR